MENRINVILAEDKLLYRQVIRRELESLKQFNIHIISEAADGLELLEVLKKTLPDVVLLDLEMPKMDGNTTFNILIEKYPNLKIIILSFHSEQLLIENYLERGAKGFISKDDIMGDAVNLASMIKKIHHGGKLKYTSNSKPYPELTETQKDIIHLKASGKLNEEIGDELGMTGSGVGKQIKKIMAKMGFSRKPEFYNHLAKSGLEFLRKPKKKKD